MVHNYALRRDLLRGGFQIGKPVKDPTAVVTMLNFHANEEIGFVFNAFGRWAPSGRRHGEPHDTQILKLLLDHGEDINALDCIIGYSSVQRFEYCTVLDICIFLLATVVSDWNRHVLFVDFRLCGSPERKWYQDTSKVGSHGFTCR